MIMMCIINHIHQNMHRKSPHASACAPYPLHNHQVPHLSTATAQLHPHRLESQGNFIIRFSGLGYSNVPPPDPAKTYCKAHQWYRGDYGVVEKAIGGVGSAECLALVAADPTCNQNRFLSNNDNCYCYHDTTLAAASCSEWVSGGCYISYQIVGSELMLFLSS